jgi:hypothetical protein
MFSHYWQVALVATGCLLPTEWTTAQTYRLNPNNGHYYRFEFNAVTWEQANNVAMQSLFAGIDGHLATITSADEQAFIDSTFFLFEKVWLGGFQPPSSHEPDGNWRWVTGEPFVYTHWPLGEPNNRDDNENLLEMFPGGYWNDVGATEVFSAPSGQLTKRSYIIEFSVPEPLGVLNIAGSSLVVFLFRRRT